MKRLVDGYLGKDKKLYAAFMDLEKAYDRVDRETLWSVLRICGVGGQLLKGIQTFYREADACVLPDFVCFLSSFFCLSVCLCGCMSEFVCLSVCLCLLGFLFVRVCVCL